MRTKNTKAEMKYDLLITADWHLRETPPACRKDIHYLRTLQNKVLQIVDMANQYNVPILIAGDVFDHWKPSPVVLSMVIEELGQCRCKVIAIPGQHDLRAHDINSITESGLCVLEKAGVITLLLKGDTRTLPGNVDITSLAFLEEGFEEISLPKSKHTQVVVAHRYIYSSEAQVPEWMQEMGDSTRTVRKRSEGVDLVVCGDNHDGFWEPDMEGGNPDILVPGSIVRTTSDSVDRKPRVWLWSANRKIECRNLNFIRDAVQEVGTGQTKKERERMDAFIRRLQDEMELDLSFEENMKRALEKAQCSEAVRRLVWEAVEGGKE